VSNHEPHLAVATRPTTRLDLHCRPDGERFWAMAKGLLLES